MAFRIGEELVCLGCYNEKGDREFLEKDVLSAAEVELKKYFCDRCGEQI